MNETIPAANWEHTPLNEPLEPTLNNVDNESLATQERERYKQDTRQRQFLVLWVVWVSSIWLGCVIVILILCGLKWIMLDAVVLDVLLATTTANVLGLVYIVLKGLFGDKTSKDNNRNAAN